MEKMPVTQPHFTTTAQTAFPGDGMGRPWNGSYVNNSGTLVEDLLANYLLEIGARNHKMRVYEMTTHPTALEMIGYLLVRGGTHIIAYAKAIEVATGVEVGKMLPVPSLDNNKFDYARKFMDKDYIMCCIHGENPIIAISTKFGKALTPKQVKN